MPKLIPKEVFQKLWTIDELIGWLETSHFEKDEDAIVAIRELGYLKNYLSGDGTIHNREWYNIINVLANHRERALLEKIEVWVIEERPDEFKFSKGVEHKSCEDGVAFCRECNNGMMRESRRLCLSDILAYIKELKEKK